MVNDHWRDKTNNDLKERRGLGIGTFPFPCLSSVDALMGICCIRGKGSEKRGVICGRLQLLSQLFSLLPSHPVGLS